jgi:uncharacterized FAD-dependent dehydrogenase
VAHCPRVRVAVARHLSTLTFFPLIHTIVTIIHPASTNATELCVNGMSFSRRDSAFANSALVVTIDPDDPVLDVYRPQYGVLAGLAFQRDMERRAAIMGGGNLTVPVQRVTDFLHAVPSTSAPPSSYRLAVRPSGLHELYPPAITAALSDALSHHFERQLPGYVCDEALLHGVETRTSSPLRIARDPVTGQAVGVSGLFPAGEGAGFAGGIVSAAVDGRWTARAVIASSSSRRDGVIVEANDDRLVGGPAASSGVDAPHY